MEYHHGERVRHLGTLPAMAADRYGEKTAFSVGDADRTYAEFDAEVDRVATALVNWGVQPGERVGLLFPNTIRFPAAFFGVVRAGAVSTPLNLELDPDTLEYVVRDAGVETLIASSALGDDARELAEATTVETLFVPGIDEEGGRAVDYDRATAEADAGFEQVERDPDDACVQVYTSGTTGRPKGVPLGHTVLLSGIESFGRCLPIDAEDTALLATPMFHVYGSGMLGLFTYTGGSTVIGPDPSPAESLAAIDDHGVTVVPAVPAIVATMYREYREAPGEYDLSSLRVLVSAGAPLSEDVRRSVERAWDVRLVETWGMTEAPAATLEPAHGVRKEAGCVGPPLPGVELELVDPVTHEPIVPREELEVTSGPESDAEDDASTGELAIKGPSVFDGYHGGPAPSEETFDDDGWFYTGDVGRIDGDGYVWLVDRADDMIVTGGNNVYPAEVEAVLTEHPDVAHAAVVAAPHEVKGEAPVAVVVPESGADPDEEGIRSFALERLAAYAHPRRVFVVEELPRSATQKVQRHRLEAAVGRRLDGPLEPGSGEL